jgi:two-component system sensor histidine kinase PilS (NtrC family)
VVGLTYVASLVYIALLEPLRRFVVAQAYIQFLGDLLLISSLVFYFGGAASSFSLLYLIVIMTAAVLLRRPAAMLVAGAAFVLYASILIGLHYQWIPHPNNGFWEPTSASRLAYTLATHLFAFYAVAQLTSYLTHSVARAKQELEERSESLADLQVAHQDIVQSISSGLLTTDLGGVITSINRVGEQLLERESGALVGSQVELAGLFDRDSWQRYVAACGDEGKVRTETDLVTPSGRRLPVGLSMTPLTDSHGVRRGFIVVFQDLSETRKLEEELRMKDRMAAVGELAAGIAHELGNPLAAISGSVQMMTSGDNGGQQQRLLGILLKESQRLDRTIKSFLQFARPRPIARSRFDIAKLLSDHLELLRNSRELGDDHRLEVELEPPEAWMVADPDQVSQIFWNLVRNALRAMPGPGTLTVSGRLEGDSYLLQVSDTGCGMTEEERAKLFHPFKSFFDRGTGIGMAIVYRIVEEHGGRLRVESIPGQGTTITTELPISSPVSASEPAEVAT